MKEKLKLIVAIVIAVAILGLIGWIVYDNVRYENEEVSHPVATFELQDYGTVKMELYPEYAPNTVANFIALIQAGYYNNKNLYGKDTVCLYMGRNAHNHEEGEEETEEENGPLLSQIDNSVEKGSDADYTYEINGEFIANGFDKNTLRHEKGVVSLNRYDYSSYGLSEEGYNSGAAQFSVMMDNVSTLNGVYCAFAKVTEGLDILENIYQNAEVAKEESEEDTAEATETDETADSEEEEKNSIKQFANMPVITNATVETYGVDYGKPEVHEAFDIQAYINQLYSSYYTN